MLIDAISAKPQQILHNEHNPATCACGKCEGAACAITPRLVQQSRHVAGWLATPSWRGSRGARRTRCPGERHTRAMACVRATKVAAARTRDSGQAQPLQPPLQASASAQSAASGPERSSLDRLSRFRCRAESAVRDSFIRRDSRRSSCGHNGSPPRYEAVSGRWRNRSRSGEPSRDHFREADFQQLPIAVLAQPHSVLGRSCRGSFGLAICRRNGRSCGGLSTSKVSFSHGILSGKSIIHAEPGPPSPRHLLLDAKVDRLGDKFTWHNDGAATITLVILGISSSTVASAKTRTRTWRNRLKS